MEFELGQTYSGYKFLDVVARSRTAVEYHVQNTLAQRVESLRTPAAAAGDDPDAAERFLREVRIRARLSHPHIVTFYTALPIDGRMAMTTELADWPSLAERLKPGALPWAEALDVARQLLEALGCMHQQSFVHCGITPENILLGPGGFCKLADFSLARPFGPAQTPESGAVVGNPRYISPEQVKGEGNLDPRSDLYSAGVVLYEMLCGRPPFESRSHFELMMAHVLQAPAPPSAVQPKVPRFLDAVMLKALAKDARERYASAAAFCEAIAAAHAATVAEARVEPAPLGARSVPAAEPACEAALATVEVPEPAPAMQDAGVVAEPVAIPAPEPACETGLTIVEVPEPAPVVEAAVVAEPVAIPAPELACEAAPAIVEVPAPAPAMVEAAVVAEPVASPAPEVVCDAGLASVEVPAPAPALVMVEAAVVAEPVAIPAPEPACEAAPAIVEVPAPAPAPAMVEAAVAPEPVAIPAPELACEAAPAIVEVPAPEPAAVLAEAAVMPEPVAIPAPEAAPAPEPAAVLVEAAVMPEPVAIPAPEAAVAPPDALQNNLWAAAAMVAEAASTHVAPVPAPAPAPLPLAAPAPEPVPVPQPAPAPAPEAGPLPVFMTTLRRVPDSLQWAVFGGTAAFLGVIWVAIWFATGK